MLMYHASTTELPIGDCLRTPTGRSKMDVLSGGVVYLTDTPERCRRYGTVYEIEVSYPVPYREQRRLQGLSPKKGKYTRGVFVALPENTRILRKVDL